jgi:cell wall-associated NlpC family hydrolase
MSTLEAKLPTPVFNTPNIPFNHLPLKKDSQGLIREIETIALPGTVFELVRPVSEHMIEVTSKTYPSSTLYVDKRFLQLVSFQPKKRLPSRESIVQWMQEAVGTRYFWGGNWKSGIPEMLEFYPHLKNASVEDQGDALCLGLDCSGLLYQATNGLTPRNTSELISFGQQLSPRDQLQPLDLIVWKGHVLIALTHDLLIESRRQDGVVISSFENRYPEVCKLTAAENKTIYFRRWYTEELQEEKDCR